MRTRPQTQEFLAQHTTLQIGGPARQFLEVDRAADLIAAINEADGAGSTAVLLGGGSNVLIADEGLDATVIRVATRGVNWRSAGDSPELTVAAGEPWDAFVAQTVEAGLAGLECLSGIPGSVGATPVQNVGAYGQQVADTLVCLRALDRRRHEVVILGAAECGFSYRSSHFKAAWLDRYAILDVTVRLRRGPSALPRHPELRAALQAATSAAAPVACVREAIMALRRRKGMVLDADDPDTRSAGSFFTNPVVTASDAARVEQSARLQALLSENEPLPHYPLGGDQVKLPAAWLIERAGFAKGHTQGAVGLSCKHALAIVNRGGGTARAVLSLARAIRDEVYRRFHVRLLMEPTPLGFGPAVADLVGTADLVATPSAPTPM